VVVVTPGWDSTAGMLRRFERDDVRGGWRPVGAPVAVVVGRTGLAWDGASSLAPAGAIVKQEGDGRSPAGAFPLDTAFGFAPVAASAAWVRLPYAPLLPGSECVDDAASVHYNTVVDRDAVARVDWTSAERMRQVGQYRLGVIVGYNAAPPRKGAGSCIFLHIWAGPRSTTAGCTAFDAVALEELVRWLDPAQRPMMVQLPAAEYGAARAGWGLPAY
jgi:D-alanyl-D-alanine dipeptidase